MESTAGCRSALILGITGQTGSYLAERLLADGYSVHGTIRRSSSFNTGRIDHIFDKLTLHYADLMDPASIRHAIVKSQPDEVYNLAAQSHVKVSFDQPVYTCDTVAIGALNVLEAVREYRDAGHDGVRLYQASSSEMFGDAPPSQSENTEFRPLSPYACAKVFAYHATRMYRRAYGLWACNGILFNHESPRRGETFVTRKITRAACRIALGLQKELRLGNMNAIRDWGFAGDYVDAIVMMMRTTTPDDFVVGTGRTATVSAFINEVQSWIRGQLRQFDFDLWTYIRHDDRYTRPLDVPNLRANPEKAFKVLGWVAGTQLHQLVDLMMTTDWSLAEREKIIRDSGLTKNTEPFENTT